MLKILSLLDFEKTLMVNAPTREPKRSELIKNKKNLTTTSLYPLPSSLNIGENVYKPLKIIGENV